MHLPSTIKRAAVITVGLLAITSMAAPSTTPKTFAEMTLDPEGFVHVADDGVARSYAADGSVIDYAPLGNEQLIKFAGNLPPFLAGEKEHLEGVFAGVDGHAVKSHSQIFKPAAHLRPNTAELPADTSANAAVEAKRQLELDPRYVL